MTTSIRIPGSDVERFLFLQEIAYLRAMILKLTERVDRMEKTVDIRIGELPRFEGTAVICVDC